MTILCLYFSLLAALVTAQSSGTFTLNVTSPSSSSNGCIILAQVASLSKPSVLTAMTPICPSSTGDMASQPTTGMTIDWPLSASGDGASSALAIYAQVTGTGDSATAGCVMSLTQMQAMYLLGRKLNWDDSVGEVWDYTAGGYLVDPETYQTIQW